MADQSDFRVEFDPGQFAGLMNALKAFEPKLATATRRNLRRAGDDTISDMRSVVSGGPGSGKFGVKSGIQSGLKTAVATGKRKQGVRITGTASKLPDKRKPMLRLYNKPSFRHPVFGTGAWVVQGGQPYFGSVIKRHETDLTEAVWQALEEAYNKMAGA